MKKPMRSASSWTSVVCAPRRSSSNRLRSQASLCSRTTAGPVTMSYKLSCEMVKNLKRWAQVKTSHSIRPCQLVQPYAPSVSVLITNVISLRLSCLTSMDTPSQSHRSGIVVTGKSTIWAKERSSLESLPRLFRTPILRASDSSSRKCSNRHQSE